jgi:hypothetical protein
MRAKKEEGLHMSKTDVSGELRIHRSRGARRGRARALAMLDRLMTETKNQKAFAAALEAEFRKDPVRFFITMVMPLLPRKATLSADYDGVVKRGSAPDGAPAIRGGGAAMTENQQSMTTPEQCAADQANACYLPDPKRRLARLVSPKTLSNMACRGAFS